MTGIAFTSALKFAIRESRSALKNFKIFIASLFLGTAIIAGVGSVTANISESIRDDGRIFLGGDVEISQIQNPLSKDERAYISEIGHFSEIATMRTMGHRSDDSSLIDLKAVDGAYPLYGELILVEGKYNPDMLLKKGGASHASGGSSNSERGANDSSPHQIKEHGQWGVLISSALQARLGLKMGDSLRLGILDYTVRGIISNEPDGNNQGFQLAPGAMVSLASMGDNSLIQQGSMVRYYNRIKLPASLTPGIFRENLKDRFPDHSWRVRDSSSGGAGLRNFIGRMGQFMALVGLAALLVGGVGVSNAVRAYLDSKRDTIATYKILGATGRVVLMIYLGQIMLIATVAILLGLATGGLLPIMASELLKDNLPITLNLAFYPKPLLLAAFYSFAIALIFTLWPLGKAVQVKPARLFRQTVSLRQGVKQSLPYIIAISGLLILLISVVIYVSEFRRLTAGTLAAAAIAFALLMAVSYAIQRMAKVLSRPKSPLLHIALSNIYRPGNATSSIILSLGLGLILFTAIALIEYNMLKEIRGRVSGEAPSFFFIDIQKDQHDEFAGFLKSRAGVETYRIVPNLRGRVTHIKDIEASKVQVKREGRWILRGDKGITFSHILPEDNQLTAGKWWGPDYNGPPQVSISLQMADSMGLEIGDEITVNILGRDFTLEISSIRDFYWENFSINYVMMVDPNILKSAPFTYVATAKVAATDEAVIYRELYQKFPAMSIIRMTDVLSNALILLEKLSSAIDAMAAITIMSGILVLAGAIAAGHKSRIYDAAILKIVGATRGDIIKAYVIEFILLGILAGFIALILGSFGAYAVISLIMEMPWTLPFDIPMFTVSASIFATLGFGMVSIWLAMSVRPAQILRNQ